MTTRVVDASVAMKWFLPEEHQDYAQRLRDASYEFHAPTLLDVEVGNVLWKKLRRQELTRSEVDVVVAELDHLPLTRHPELPLLASAIDLADLTQRTVYDSLYLALAIQLNAKMVTADLRLYNALSATRFSNFVVWIEDIP